MSRFTDDYDEFFPNQADLWWANIGRALKGRKGQRALMDLEQALLDLPEKRLISGYLAADGEVCAVAALALSRRMWKGEARDAILASFEEKTPPVCECGHLKSVHDDDGHCTYLTEWNGRGCWEACVAFRLAGNDHENYDSADVTATVGVEVGLTYGLAWRLAYLNDEDFGGLTPEDRYERVLEWTRSQIGTPA